MKTVKDSHLLFTLTGALMHRVFVEQSPVSKRYLEGLADLVLYGASVDEPESGTTR